jgi:hypothetical protein
MGYIRIELVLLIGQNIIFFFIFFPSLIIFFCKENFYILIDVYKFNPFLLVWLIFLFFSLLINFFITLREVNLNIFLINPFKWKVPFISGGSRNTPVDPNQGPRDPDRFLSASIASTSNFGEGGYSGERKSSISSIHLDISDVYKGEEPEPFDRSIFITSLGLSDWQLEYCVRSYNKSVSNYNGYWISNKGGLNFIDAKTYIEKYNLKACYKFKFEIEKTIDNYNKAVIEGEFPRKRFQGFIYDLKFNKSLLI